MWAQTSKPGENAAAQKPSTVTEADKKIMEVSKNIPTELGLSGTLTESDEYKETLDSLKSAESQIGKTMAQPKIDSKKYNEVGGSKVQNLLEDDHRITAAEIEQGMKDSEEFKNEKAEAKQNQQKSDAAKKAQKQEQDERQFNNLAIPHFMNDDLFNEPEFWTTFCI